MKTILTFLFGLAILLTACDADGAEKPAEKQVERLAATLQPPVALWMPFEVVTPGGTKTKLILVPSQYPDRFVLLTSDFQTWHIMLADTPQPSPSPTPQPAAQTIWITVVEETSQRTPQQAAVINSKAVADLIQARGHYWRAIDQNARNEQGQAPADLAAYVQRSAGRLPYVILTDSAGKILFEGPLPATEQAMLDLVKKYGG
jgi:hypothetical protein